MLFTSIHSIFLGRLLLVEWLIDFWIERPLLRERPLWTWLYMKRTWTYFSDVYSRIGFSGIIFLSSDSFALTVTNYSLSSLIITLSKSNGFYRYRRSNSISSIRFNVQVLLWILMTSLLPGYIRNWNLIFRLWAVMFESGIKFKSIIIFNLIMTLTIWIRSFFLMPLTWVQSEIPPFYISPFFRQTLNSMPDAKSKEVQRKESMTAGKGVVRTNYQLRKLGSRR